MAGEHDRWFLRRITPYRTADNRIDGVVISFIEITERMKVEEALRASEENTRKQYQRTVEILESISDAFYAVDADLRFTYVNRRAELLWGRRREDLIGRQYQAEFPQALGPELSELHAKVMHQRQPAQAELYLPALQRWIDISIYPESSGGLSCFFREITDRKEAAEALRASEERFRLLVEGADDFAMMLVDPDGLVTLWNEGAQRMLGYTEAEAIRMDAAVIFTSEDRAAGAPERELAKAKQTGCAIDERWHLRKDGSRFWGSGTMRALYRPDRTIKGYAKIFRDETARKAAEDALRASRVAAEQANHAKDEFLAVLSRELRTPLSAILLWTNLLNQIEAHDAKQLREISPEFLPRIFERFSQAENSSTRTHGGIGLGLNIAKQLVELHGGAIAAESHGADRGATFIVYLPLLSGEGLSVANADIR